MEQSEEPSLLINYDADEFDSLKLPNIKSSSPALTTYTPDLM